MNCQNYDLIGGELVRLYYKTRDDELQSYASQDHSLAQPQMTDLSSTLKYTHSHSHKTVAHSPKRKDKACPQNSVCCRHFSTFSPLLLFLSLISSKTTYSQVTFIP